MAATRGTFKILYSETFSRALEATATLKRGNFSLFDCQSIHYFYLTQQRKKNDGLTFFENFF